MYFVSCVLVVGGTGTLQLRLQAGDALALLIAALLRRAQLAVQLQDLLLVGCGLQLQLSLPGCG